MPGFDDTQFFGRTSIEVAIGETPPSSTKMNRVASNTVYLYNKILSILNVNIIEQLPVVGVSSMDAVRWNGTELAQAIGDTEANSFCIGFAKNVAGGFGDVFFNGLVSGFVGLVAGDTYYLSTTNPGGITNTKPVSGVLVKVGVAKSTTELLVDVDRDIFADVAAESIKLLNIAESGCANGDIVYWNGSALVPANAVLEASSWAVGMIDNISGGVGDVTLFGKVTGLSGLSAGQGYYLSWTTPGDLSSTAPTVTDGQTVRCGVAKSVTEFWVNIDRDTQFGFEWYL